MSLAAAPAPARFYRVYRFLAKPATKKDNDVLHEQMKLGGDYQRVLAAIESEKRAAIEALYLAEPEIAVVEAKLQEALADTTDGRTEAINGLSAALRRLRSAYAKTDAFKEKVGAVNLEYGPRPRAARAEFSAKGLFWGTYLVVEEAIDRARQDTPPWEPIKVRRPWESIAVQLQTGTPMVTGASLRSGAADTRVRLSPQSYALGERVEGFQVIGTPDQRNHAGNLRPASFQMLSLRIGGTGSGNRQPIWANFHILTGRGGSRGRKAIPRQIPDHGRVAWVKMVRTECLWRSVFDRQTMKMTVRPFERWEVQFTVEEAPQRSQPTGHGIIGVDIGWRRVDGGIRVGYAMTKRGFSQCIIPDRVLSKREHADGIRSVRDKHMDMVRAEILRYRQVLSGEGSPRYRDLRSDDTAKEWFLEATTTAHSWKRLYHFVKLARLMVEKEWKDGLVYGLHAWLAKDAHLREFEAGDRRRQRLQIRGRIQSWLAQILDGHDVLAIEKTIRVDKMRARATARSEGLRRAAVAHPEVPPGSLRTWAIQMATSRGLEVRQVNPINTTALCPVCRAVRKIEVALVVKCEACGYSEDQDMTAAREIAIRAADSLQLALDVDNANSPKKVRVRRTRKAVKATAPAGEAP